MSELLDKIKNNLETGEEQAPSDYLEKKEDFVIKDDIEYPEPEYLLSINDTATLPKGNLVALSAKWKNGKTFFCDIISGVFLGSRRFNNLRSLAEKGRVQIFDTEQAVSDTARMRKIIRTLTLNTRNDDFEVFCLRNAQIDKLTDNDDDVSRYEFIVDSINHFKPDLVVIDGIADLIYNYNDVIESQTMVNNLATLASKNDCCIVVVMHQNKSKQDKSMKGHIGTMLFQKCSDVFNIEKISNLFVVTHAVSRHRQCGEFIFKIDDDGTPISAAADHQALIEMKAKQENSKLESFLSKVFGDEKTLPRNTIVKRMKEDIGLSQSRAYRLINEALDKKLLVEDGKNFKFSQNEVFPI